MAWVLGEDLVVNSHPVKIGAAVGGELEIVQGLQPGDRVVIAGVAALRARDEGSGFGRRIERRIRRWSAMNAAEFSVRNNRVIFVAMFFVLVGGFVAYDRLGRLEIPSSRSKKH